MTITNEATTSTAGPPVILPFDVPDELAALEATDVTLIGEALETVDIGPLGGIYYRVAAPDLMVAIDDARKLLNQAEEAVLDARQARIEAERHRCYCDALLDADEETCGSVRCGREYALDRQGLIP